MKFFGHSFSKHILSIFSYSRNWAVLELWKHGICQALNFTGESKEISGFGYKATFLTTGKSSISKPNQENSKSSLILRRIYKNNFSIQGSRLSSILESK